MVVLLLLRGVTAVIEQWLIPATSWGDRWLSGGLLIIRLALQEG